MAKLNTTKEIVRIGDKLKEIVTVHDDNGNLVHKIIRPVMLEFRLHDLIQIIVGSTLLAIPLAYTEETWFLGIELSWLNIAMLSLLSLLFIGLFVYYNVYHEHINQLEKHFGDYLIRVLLTYVLSLIVVGTILTIINRAPWHMDAILSLKRTIIIAFPASLSATVADMIK